MSRWRTIAAMSVFMLGNWAATHVALAQSFEVVITDRGPASRNRVLDLSLGAARALGIGSRGIIQVRAEIVSGHRIQGDPAGSERALASWGM